MIRKHEKNKLYFVELDAEIGFSRYEPLLKLLSEEKQTRILKFQYDMDKKLRLISDLFVRCLACEYLKVKNYELKFDINDYGNPIMVGVQDFYDNVSYTRNAFVVGIAQTSIGVDVEKICRFEKRVSERFFCKEEEYIEENDNENAEQRFYEVWTPKEAYIKWMGRGLSIPLNSFSFLKRRFIII